MRPGPFVLFIMACSSLACCGPQQTPPGYDGPLPSIEARQKLDDVMGATIIDGGEALGDGTWTLDYFAVIPNPRTGKSPVMCVRSGDRIDWIPLLTDGDIADLYRRVRGTVPEGISGEMSRAYQDVWRDAGER